MDPELPIGIIELGDTDIKCVIFKINNNNDSEILSTSITKSLGIRNDLVVNLKKASSVIRLCISEAERKAKVSLKKINVVFEQPDFLCTRFSKSKKIDGSKIFKEDIEFLLSEAKKQLILNDKNQSIIHIFNHSYIVDKKNFVEEPIGVYADSLTHEMTFITTKKNNLKNIKQVFIDCDIEVEKFISKTFTLGVELLDNKKLQFGSFIIDLEFEKVSFAIFKNLAIIHSITIPIGINHIAKDISKMCSIDLEESVNIINNIDFSFNKDQYIFDENNYLKESYFKNSNFRKISKNLILDVVKARLDEIFEKLNNQLILSGVKFSSQLGFALHGGFNLQNIEKYFVNYFGPDLKTLELNKIKKNKDIEKNFNACYGAIKIIKDGWETEAIPEKVDKNIDKTGFFAKIFKFNW